MRRLTKTAAILTLVTGLALGAAPAAMAAPYPGDVNGDGKVDIADLRAYSAANPSNTTVADIVKNWGTTAPPEPTPGTLVLNAPSTSLAFSSWGDYNNNVANFGHDWGDNGTRSVIHLDNVQIDKGADVTAATLKVTPKAGDPAQGGLGSRVAAIAGDNVQKPTTAAGITTAPLSVARSAKWLSTAAAWTGTPTAPSIEPVIQEMVNRADWNKGDDIVLITYNDGSTGNGWFPATAATVELSVTAPTTPTTPPPATGTDPGPLTANAGRPFTADGPWNAVLPANPALDPNSAAMVNTIDDGATANIYAYADPVFTAASSDPLATVNCTENWGTCEPETTGVRLPAVAAPTTGSDGRMIIVDLGAQKACDFWQATRSGNSITASWATCVPLNDRDAAGPQGGATGGGVNALAGVIRTFEVRAATASNSYVIPHALSMATGNSCGAPHRYPMTKTDGNKTGGNCVPEGARLQLDPSINVDAIPNITPIERAVAKTLQQYGVYNRDNCGANLCLSFEGPTGESDPYPAAGVPNDYWGMPNIPWNRLRVVNASVTQP